jgi:hypothetical protein
VAAAPFAFQIYVQGGQSTNRQSVREHSVFVEISPKAVALTPGGQNKERAELELAQRIAVEAAVEAIRKDLPDEVKFDRSVAQIGELPQEIRGRAPSLLTIDGGLLTHLLAIRRQIHQANCSRFKTEVIVCRVAQVPSENVNTRKSNKNSRKRGDIKDGKKRSLPGS